jgi:G3E family GTPase
MPVYLFTGFLEGGKTSIIQESMEDKRFNGGEKTLVFMCEEGIEELDPSAFWGKNVYIEYIENESDLTAERLMDFPSKHKIDRVIIEYNGMWQLSTLYENLPKDWFIFQNMMFADANTFLSYNKNMRPLMVDKLLNAEMVVLNRTPDDIDKDEIHKVIRGITRRAAITYDYPDGHVEYDDIEDPLPFDKEADVIEIEDEDYALWYRDMVEELDSYDGKTVSFKGMVARDSKLGDASLVLGRHIMTCCEDDIQFSGLLLNFKLPVGFNTRDWIRVTGKIKVEKAKMYRGVGPVIYVSSFEKADKPKNEVATFY